MTAARLIPCLAIAGALGACQTMTTETADTIATTQLRTTAGAPAGVANVYAAGDVVTVSVALQGLEPGVHAVHLHTTGDCSAADFTSAGGHLNPFGREHGRENPDGQHLGDLPNATVGSAGTGTVSASLPVTRAEAIATMFDADGTAVVVHAGADDYRTDPAGDAGSRVACGVLAAS